MVEQSILLKEYSYLVSELKEFRQTMDNTRRGVDNALNTSSI